VKWQSGKRRAGLRVTQKADSKSASKKAGAARFFFARMIDVVNRKA